MGGEGMPWNKVNPDRSWTKVEIEYASKRRTRLPLATLCKCKDRFTKIYLNDAAYSLAKELGLEHETMDAYRSGAEWAFAKGERFIFTRNEGKTVCSGYIAGERLCDRIWTATKCKRFRVSRQDEYLVLTPAYDLETEAL